ncbi:cobaltochelatase subunit CobN [Plectonema cf. radiosum LEGE 06105]|uniref:Cobaltochelatase subunit CobN n=1 Tax=Plectonema cf. radiosum LEGE 06105 TaxID=945769 RepID=A0A8J7EYY0_9CYAN|nr:cobaltochelatase subunit CobN [Plectonema radiosum]MBE9212706.1 cobaltochelatase subunit CobN [Plectonema cf. radiosum LEGE 06105]
MHRISASNKEFNLQSEDLIFLEQTTAKFVFLTSADTDIQTIAAAVSQLPPNFDAIRVANLLNLQHQISIDNYAEQVLEFAQVIILRLLGGSSYWSYGLEVVLEIVQRNGTNLIVIPGEDTLDLNLISHSTLPLTTVNQISRYFSQGGVDNFAHAFKFIADKCFSSSFNPPPPVEVPKFGLYDYLGKAHEIINNAQLPKVAILFYRAHYLSGNTLVIDALCQALAKRNIQPVAVFVSSLREIDVQQQLSDFFQAQNGATISFILNTTSFSLARLETERPSVELWEKLDVPVLQVILSSSSIEEWESSSGGLSPRDIAMNVALPEVDGRIISRAVSFKTVQNNNSALQTDVIVYQPVASRIEFVTDLAANWVKLRSKSPTQRRIALILANYPTRDGRLANGVGLDTPQSCIEILEALQNAGYDIENIPENGNELIELLIAGVTNDSEARDLRKIRQSLSFDQYQEYFTSLPQAVQEGICQRWGDKGTRGQGDNYPLPITHYPLPITYSQFPISGIQLGNIFIGIQPARGYDIDPSLNYHAPDLEPTHAYLAFYYWIRKCFAADAVVHVGKHGNLEWLPGKSIALSENCYPEVALSTLPHLYPFIVNDPGEGSQAKRRAQAVIVDHLTPPLTRAELYGPLVKLENLVDEYYEAINLDPKRLTKINEKIRELILQENLHLDLQFNPDKFENQIQNSVFNHILNSLDGYLCELKEAQIRDGLHIFGKCPTGRQLRDLIIAIARYPNRHHAGLTRAIAKDLGWDFDPLTDNPAQAFSNESTVPCRNVGDAIELLEEYANRIVEQVTENSLNNDCVIPLQIQAPESQTQIVLQWIRSNLLPSLEQTNLEIKNLLRGLDGRYVKSAPSGSPTRGRPEVLPTGNNFYSVDIRAIPTESAWDVGRKAAETLVETYTQENGEYPKTLALSVWGTATMRTGGDDIAQALALLGVQPVWDGASRRVVDFDILPISILQRPRVDVTLRISGFFRDAFPNLIELFDRAVIAVAALDESPEYNPLAVQVSSETELWMKQGLNKKAAQTRSQYRIFGSKGGAYGAGLQGLIESQNWNTDQDLARAYINWSCYAYTGKGFCKAAPEAFEQRLVKMQVVLHNQDNREHDLLDSDDYYQFQGGLTVAVRSLTGKNPQIYFGDNSKSFQPRVRKLQQEIARVYRSRVVNPKWIEGVMRHGYKGAFEIAATVDYLFAYDATANCVENHMYQGIAQAYLFEPNVCEFIENNNPHALRDIAERLLEAYQRGLWQDVNISTIDNLRNLVHQAEAAIEEKSVV